MDARARPVERDEGGQSVDDLAEAPVITMTDERQPGVRGRRRRQDARPALGPILVRGIHQATDFLAGIRRTLRGETARVDPPEPAGNSSISVHVRTLLERGRCASWRPTGLAVGFGPEASRPYAPPRRDSPLVWTSTCAS